MVTILFEEECGVLNKILPGKGGGLPGTPKKLVRVEKGNVVENPSNFFAPPKVMGSEPKGDEGVSLFDRPKCLTLPNE